MGKLTPLQRTIISRLRDLGLSYGDIAGMYKVSRSTIYQITHPEVHRIRMKDYVRSRITRTGSKSSPVYIVGDKRPRPDGCELCDVNGKRFSYHHWGDELDDKGMLVGVWLCYRCHMAAEALDDNPDLGNLYAHLKKKVLSSG